MTNLINNCTKNYLLNDFKTRFKIKFKNINTKWIIISNKIVNKI